MRRYVVFASVLGLLAGLLVAAPGAVAAPEARPTDDSCPPGEVPAAGFTDVPETDVHGASIDCIVWWELATGTSPTTYAPTRVVTREQMATFVLRLITVLGVEPLDNPPDAFTDDEGSIHEPSINQLAAQGIVGGVAPGRYNPAGVVTRDQMATFLVRAYELAYSAPLPAGDDAFPDDDGNTHEPNINKAAAAGFTGGRADGTYNPSGQVLRDQMASFLARVLDLGVEQGLATLPGGGTGSALIVAAEGGTVTSADGKLTIDIPPHAMHVDTVITIEEVPEDELPDALASDPDLLRPVYRLGPDGQTFSLPVTIARRVDVAAFDELEDDAVPVVRLGTSDDDGDGGAWIDGIAVERLDDQVVATGQITHFSVTYVMDSQAVLVLFPHEVDTSVGATWDAEVRVIDVNGSETRFEFTQLYNGATGVVAVENPEPTTPVWRCDAPGEGKFSQAVRVRDNLHNVEQESTPKSRATCREAAGPAVALDQAAVCTDHGYYQPNPNGPSYPSSLVIRLIMSYSDPSAEGASASLLIDDMNNDQPLVFDLPPPTGGDPVDVVVRGGINNYGHKEIQAFEVTFTTTPTVDLVADLRNEVGDSPNVTASEGRIGGTADCPAF